MLSAGIEDAAQVGEDVRHAHQVMVVAARASTGLERHQAEQILQTQGDAGEKVVLELLDGDHRVRLESRARDGVLLEHLPAARRIDPNHPIVVAVDERHVELAQHRQQLHGRLVRMGRALHAHIHDENLGFRPLAQQAQRGTRHRIADQLLAMPLVHDHPVG